MTPAVDSVSGLGGSMAFAAKGHCAAPGPSQDDDSGSAAASAGACRTDAEGVERGAGGVVFDEHGRVLLLRHASGAWIFPKGHVERGETELQAALREVEEEAGVRAWCEDTGSSWSTRYVNPRGALRQITWFALRSDDPAAASEALFSDAAYFPPARALELLTHPQDVRLLADIVAVGHGSSRPDGPREGASRPAGARRR